MASQPACPKDAEAMDGILRDMGAQDYEPRVINQLLDFAYRYSSDLIEDARVYSEHSGKREIEQEDVRLAISTRVENSFSRPPPRELILELAKEKNSAPLPPIKQQYGLRLPPDRHCLLQPNYRLTSKSATQRPPSAPPPSTPTHHQQSPAPSSNSGSGVKRKHEDIDEDYDKD